MSQILVDEIRARTAVEASRGLTPPTNSNNKMLATTDWIRTLLNSAETADLIQAVVEEAGFSKDFQAIIVANNYTVSDYSWSTTGVGSETSGAYKTRPLELIVKDETNDVVVSNDTVLLPRGRYLVFVECHCKSCAHAIRFVPANFGNNPVIGDSQSLQRSVAAGRDGDSEYGITTLNGVLELADTTAYVLQEASVDSYTINNVGGDWYMRTPINRILLLKSSVDVDLAGNTETVASGTNIQYLDSITGVLGGTATDLDSVATETIGTPYIVMINATITAGGNIPTKFWKLRPGSDVENLNASPPIARPNDFDPATNAKVWEGL